MKRLAKTVIAATLAGTLIPAPAIALPIYEQGGYQVGQEQQAGSLMITEAGTYTLTGNLRGTVMVDPGAGEVTLVLDNVVIDGNGGPAINAVSGDKLTIVAADGTENRLISSMDGNYLSGTVMSSVECVFEGTGAISVVADEQSAVLTNNADLSLKISRLELVSAGNGVAVTGSEPGELDVDGGTIDVHAGRGALSEDTVMRGNEGSIQDLGFDERYAFDRIAASDPWAMPANAQRAPIGDGLQRIYRQGSQQPGQPAQGNQQGQQPAQGNQQGQQPAQPAQDAQQPGQPGQGQAPDQGQMGQTGLSGTTDTVGEIAQGQMTNSAADLEADMDSATYYVMDDEENNQVKISSSGTYVVSGTSTDGNITVKKGTTGVVLVLDDLDLTSTTGATLSVNKEAEVKIIVSGNVTLTDAENPADETSEDSEVADAFDGAALKAKANSQVYITGDGTLNIEGDAKNGIKGGDDASVIIDGTTINVSAVNDGINVNYDLTILSGDVTIEAGDDAIHADHIVTIGDEDGSGPTLNIVGSTEGIEGTVVNILGGDVKVNSTDDGINAANADGVYEGELGYSINQLGGDVQIKSGGDGMDSNGNVNLVGGSSEISSANAGGEAGIDYDGELYVSDEYQMNNTSGVAGPDGMPGQMGAPADMGQGGQPGGMGQTGQGGRPADMGQGCQMPERTGDAAPMGRPDDGGRMDQGTQGGESSQMSQAGMDQQPGGFGQRW